MFHNIYSPEEIDLLAKSGVETICFEPGATVLYDVECGERICRINTQNGQHKYYESSVVPHDRPIKSIPSDCVGDKPYIIRTGGFRRNDCIGPDEVAQQFKNAGFQYADSLGNGLFESLLLCKKYGIWPIFEAPTLGFSLPFIKSELQTFESYYRKKVQKMKQDLCLIEKILGHPIVGRKNQPWVLWIKYSPLQLYLDAVTKQPEAVAKELNEEVKISKAPTKISSENERAELARFWFYIRRRHAEILLLMSKVFREEIVKEGLIIGNMHGNPPVDFFRLGQIFDHPGIAVRAGYLSDQGKSESHVAFTIKLFNDLTKKMPITSIRTNLLSAGSRFIPGANCIKTWFNAALRSGSAGFYFWPRDYPSFSQGGYDGPMNGNPDDSAKGQQRWSANMAICSQVASVRQFSPPNAEVAILVAHELLDPAGWKRVFECYRVCEQSRLWIKLISNSMLEQNPDLIASYKLLLVPSFSFCSQELSSILKKYVENDGGHILTAESHLGKIDFYCKRNMSQLRTELVDISKKDFSVTDEIATQKKVVWHDKKFFDSVPETLGEKIFFEKIDALRRLCKGLSVDFKEWVYDITTDNIAELTGVLPGHDSAPKNPEITLEHYFYEHSSSWVLPYIKENK